MCVHKELKAILNIIEKDENFDQKFNIKWNRIIIIKW